MIKRKVLTPRTRSTVRALIVIASCCLAASVAKGVRPADKREIVKQAKRSYYSLRSLGLSEFQANVQPNWKVVSKDIESNPDGLRLLNGLRFSMSLGSDGNIKVNHEATIPAPNSQVEAGFKQIFGGIEEALSGIFATWNLFMLTSPFPDVESDYQLEDIGSQYLLTYKEGSTDVTTKMTKDLTITEIKVSSPEFKSSVKPQFIDTRKGKILSAYLGSYTPTTGPGKVELNVQIDYLDVDGMQLPGKIRANSTYDGTPNQMELAFSDYHVKAR